MGSGTGNRKSNDNIFIKRPKVATSHIGIGGAEGVETAEDISICIPSFEIKVNETVLTQPKVKVILQKKGEQYILQIGENEIGILSKQLSKIVMICSGMGIKYKGEIIKQKGGIYARFFRVPG